MADARTRIVRASSSERVGWRRSHERVSRSAKLTGFVCLAEGFAGAGTGSYNYYTAMMTANSDPDALTAQADIYRFYVKVIQPALAEFVPTDDIVGGETTDTEAFLEAARVDTHNALCHEMRRTFALIIGALFERQLRSWLLGKLPIETETVEGAKWPDLVKMVEKKVGDPIGTDLWALWLVANAVRHGNGGAATKLLHTAPQLWNQARMKPELRWQSDLVGNMRICDAQLERYAKAVMEFWHSAGASSMGEYQPAAHR